MRAYDFHPEAESDVNAIWDYIAEDSPDAADRTIDKIVAAIEALVPLPHLGHRRPDLTSRPLRFITAQNYLIAYACQPAKRAKDRSPWRKPWGNCAPTPREPR